MKGIENHRLVAGCCMNQPKMKGENDRPNDLAMLLIPPAALLSSDLTIVAK